MRSQATVAVIIPALNEEEAIGKVLAAIPNWVDDVVVVDNGSTDRTAEVACECGARVVSEPRRGYGSACLAGIAALDEPDVVVFLDGDFSDHPEEMPSLVAPILDGEADLVIGSRVLGQHEPGALTPQARFGNRLACTLIRLLWKVSYTDLGPFRAIRHSTLKRLDMRDRSYGWTVEMQIKAAQEGLRVREVPVSYRRRIGRSKVSGTVKGVLGAGTKILSTIFLAALSRRDEKGRRRRERLIVFTRYPEPGAAKTRLIPALGPDGAATLQRQMTEQTLDRARQLAGQRGTSLEVRYEGGNHALLTQWLGTDIDCRRQGDGDLGARMGRSFRHAFQAGAERVVIVGTDCPGLTPELMASAFQALGESDLVLGPAKDGGYYLVGLRREVPEFFADMPWGTSEVLERTLAVASDLGISATLLELLDDVDRPDDLHIWEREAPREPRTRRISVIIPTLNEARYLADTLAAARTESDVEVIVVDGGSADGTAEVARSCGAEVLAASRGKASQMNAGAEAASGDVLLFLHADTRLPKGYAPHIRRALEQPGAVAGAFQFSVDGPSRSLRLIERLVNWRSRRMQMPYGDQGIFVRADLFRELGGYPDMPIMEDFELMRRLKRRGRIAIAPAPALTSGRRWLTLGVFRTTLINQLMIAAYLVGIPPARLARWYYRDRAMRREAPRTSSL